MADAVPLPDDLLQHFGFVRRLAADLVRDSHVAEEVAQNAMVVALQQRGVARQGTRAWLRGVVRNLVLNHYRSEARRRNRDTAFHEDREQFRERVSVEEALGRGEQRALVVNAVMELREPYRTVVVLRYMEAQSPARIAELLERPLETVQTQLHRALGVLREELDRRHGGERREWARALVPIALPALPPSLVAKGGGLGLAVKGALASGALAGLGAAGLWLAGWWDSAPSSAEAQLALTGVAAPPTDGRPALAGSVLAEAAPDPTSTRRAASPGVDEIAEFQGLRIRVVDASGVGVPGARLVASAGAELHTAEDGRAQLALDAAAYVEVRAPGFLPRIVTAEPEREDELVVELERAIERTVRVVDAETGEPLAGAELEVLGLSPTSLEVAFVEPAGSVVEVLDRDAWEALRSEVSWTVPPASASAIGFPSGPVGPAGETYEADRDGRARVQVGAEGHAVLHVTAAGHVSATESLQLDTGEGVTTIELEPAAIVELRRGSAPDDQAIFAIVEHVFLEACHAVELAPGESQVEIDDLPAGAYRVRASRLGDPVASPLGSQSSAQWDLVLQVGERTTLDLFAEGGADLRVRLIGDLPQGEGLTLLAMLEGDGAPDRGMPFAAPIQDGAALLTQLQPGRYELQVLSGRQTLLARSVEVLEPAGAEAGEPQEVTLELSTGELALQLVGASEDGLPRVLLHGPLASEPEERHQLARFGSEATFLGLNSGRYEVWVVEGARAWREVAEVGAGRTSLMVDLGEEPGGVLEVQRGAGVGSELQVSSAEGAALPLDLFNSFLFDEVVVDEGTWFHTSDQEEPLRIELPQGLYRVGYSLTGASWREEAVEVRSSTRLLLEDSSPLLQVDLQVWAEGAPLTGGRLMAVPSGAAQRGGLYGVRVDLGADGRGQAALRAGHYTVLDSMGRRGELEVLPSGGFTALTLR